MTRLIIALLILAVILPVVPAVAAAEYAGGECKIYSSNPWTGTGLIEWQNAPDGGNLYFASMNLEDIRTGERVFYQTDSRFTIGATMYFTYAIPRGHTWRVSEVTCYIVYANGASTTSAPNNLVYTIDTRWRLWLPVLRR